MREISIQTFIKQTPESKFMYDIVQTDNVILNILKLVETMNVRLRVLLYKIQEVKFKKSQRDMIENNSLKKFFNNIFLYKKL